jgi:hypothetical protein
VIINEQSIRDACQRLADTLVQKNHDYGNSVEEQFKEYGDASINLRLEDKLRRLKNLANNEAQVDEKKSETVLDSAGYAVLAYILYDAELNMPMSKEAIEDEELEYLRYEVKRLTKKVQKLNGELLLAQPPKPVRNLLKEGKLPEVIDGRAILLVNECDNCGKEFEIGEKRYIEDGEVICVECYECN